MSALALLVTLQLLSTPLPDRFRITSNTPCPSASDITGKLTGMFPRELFGSVDEQIDIIDGPASIRIELARSDGTPLVSRLLQRRGSCAEMAGAIAVIVVAWETQLHAELLTPPRLAPRASSAEPARPAPPALIATTEMPPRGVVAPTFIAQRPMVATLAEPARVPASRIKVCLMLGVLASVVEGDWISGGRASILATRSGRPLGVAADVWGGQSRSVALDSGRGRWNRYGASAGLAWLERRTAWAVMASAQVAIGRTEAEGAHFDLDRHSSTILPGVATGLLATWGTDRWFAWASTRALLWPIEARIQAMDIGVPTAAPVARRLGWLEADLTLGGGIQLP